MKEDGMKLAGIAGKLDGLYKYLESHPQELGANNKIFRKTLAECSKDICEMIGIKPKFEIPVS